MCFNVRTKTRARFRLLKKSGKSVPKIKRSHSSRVRPNITILQPMFSPLFFSSPPWFHWSELEMRGQQSTKPSNVWFFSKDLQKQSLAGWPLTAAHLFISPSAGTSFGRKALRFTPLSGGTSVYYVHAHSISCALAHLKGEPWLVSLTNPPKFPQGEKMGASLCVSSLLIWWTSIWGVFTSYMQKKTVGLNKGGWGGGGPNENHVQCGEPELSRMAKLIRLMLPNCSDFTLQITN